MVKSPNGDRRQLLDQLAQTLGGGDLQPDIQRRALTLFEQIVRSSIDIKAPGPPAAVATAAVAVANRRLVYVHGICQHLPGYSDRWWAALHEFEMTAFGDGALSQTRLEVLWSDVVAASAVAAAAPLTAAPNVAKTEAAREIREALNDRIDRHLLATERPMEAGTAPVQLSAARNLLCPSGKRV